MRTDLRSFLLVTGLVVTLLAGNFHIPRTGVEARVVLIGALVLVAIVLSPPHGRRPIGLIAGPLYAWAGLLLLSSLWSPNEVLGSYITDVLLLIVIIMLTVHAARTVSTESLDLVWPLFLTAGVVYLLLALASGTTAQGRLTVPGGGPNVFVRVMVIAAIAAIMIAFKRRAFWPAWLALPMAVGAVMSGSRGGVLGGLIIAALAAVPIFLSLRGGTRLLLAIFGVGGGYVAWMMLRDSGPIVAITQFVNDRFVDETLVEGYSSGRDVIAPEAWRIFTEHPAIGAGLGAWTELQATGADYVHPHNLFLSSGVDGGIAAIALICLALASLLWAVASRRPMNAGAWASLAAATAVFVSSMFSGYYYDSRLIWFFLIWAVAYVSSLPATESSTADAHPRQQPIRRPASPRAHSLSQ